MNQPKLNLSPKVSDEVRKTTCYMCACRCGINVHMKDGKVAYIEGNRDHPVNQGVLCAKGSAGIMQHNAPSRLRAPMKRVGPRGSGEFEEISWDEAYDLACEWLKPIREENPEKLAFFTGRDQSQSFTSFWAQNFGTPNYAAHGGFCSVNMAAAGIYTMGGAFWEFGQPDWDHTKLFMLFGVAEDHDSNPIKMGIGKIKARGARVIGVNPIRTGYNAVADDWVGITPGTDGLFILSMIHCLMKAGKIDLHYLAQYTDAGVLLNGDEKSPEYGLYLRDEDGKQLVIDRVTGKLAPFRPERCEAGPRRLTPRQRCHPCPGLSEDGRDVSLRRLRARGCCRPMRDSRQAHPRDCGGTRARGFRRGVRAGARMDRLPGRDPQDHDGSPRQLPCHARHLGPCQRLPDLPRAAHPADHTRHRRGARWLPLQTALPQARHGTPQAARGPHPRRAAERPAPWLSYMAPTILR